MKYIAVFILILFYMPQEQSLPKKVFKGKYVCSHEFGYMTICIGEDKIVIENESKSIINNIDETFDYELINTGKIKLLTSELDNKGDRDKLRIEDLTWDLVAKDPHLLLQFDSGDTLLFTMKYRQIVANGYKFTWDKKWK